MERFGHCNPLSQPLRAAPEEDQDGSTVGHGSLVHDAEAAIPWPNRFAARFDDRNCQRKNAGLPLPEKSAARDSGALKGRREMSSSVQFEPLLSDAQVSQLLGLHPKTVQRMARRGIRADDGEKVNVSLQ